MRLIIQRVLNASVSVDQKQVAQINNGLLVYVGFSKSDHDALIPKAVEKLINYRLFENDDGKPHYSALDIKAEILCVSQFTLYGRLDKGRRPDFGDALGGDQARVFYDAFVEQLKQTQLNIQSGIFAADMAVSSVNDGPFTFIYDID